MCLRPLKIRNNTLDFCKGRDANFYFVPCGKCYECRKAKRDDYVFRLIAERMTTKSQVFYYTLTFNDEHLPHIIVPDLKDLSKDLDYICFDKRLVQRFIKRLRKRLVKDYGITLKYFLTSEFGEKYKRPHHHVLFYLQNGSINPSEFRKLIRLFWAEPLTKKEQNLKHKDPKKYEEILDKKSYGFNKPGDNLGQVSDKSFRPLKYVAKYVAKDLTFEDYFFNYKEYLDYIVEPLDIFRIHDPHIITDCLPFTLMSNNFGLGILEKFDFNNLVNSTYTFMDENKVEYQYKIPLYFTRRLLYIGGLNENGNMHYMLNKLGYQVRKVQLDNRIEEFCHIVPYLSAYISEHPCCTDNLPYSTDDLKFMFSNFTNDEVKFIAQYKYFYRNKLSCDFDLDFNSDYVKFQTFQTSLHKAPFMFDDCNIFHLSFDVVVLEEIVKIYDHIERYAKRLNAKDKIHSEKVFKVNYYGKGYIKESEIEVLSL